MKAPTPRARRRRFPLTPHTKPVTWAIRNLVGDPFIDVRATSLSGLGHALAELDIPADRWVCLERNGTLIYRGPWKGELPDAPTLL
jgi:hypothetical protein